MEQYQNRDLCQEWMSIIADQIMPKLWKNNIQFMYAYSTDPKKCIRRISYLCRINKYPLPLFIKAYLDEFVKNLGNVQVKSSVQS